MCETGGGRRAWVRGIVNVTKSYLVRGAAHNLGVVMLALFGVGTPRSLQSGLEAVWRWLIALLTAGRGSVTPFALLGWPGRAEMTPPRRTILPSVLSRSAVFSTGC